MKIIGIAGAAGSGKDTAQQLLAEVLESQGYKCTKLSFAAKLKDICVLMFGWDRQRLEDDFDYKEGNTLDDGSPDPACALLGKTRRIVMQELGTEAMRHGLHGDVWIIALKLAIISGEYDEYDYGFIPDTRFFNELQFVKDNDGICLQVQRTGDKSTLTDQTEHLSELEWRKWTEWDGIIENAISPNRSDHENRMVFKETLRNALERAYATKSLNKENT